MAAKTKTKPGAKKARVKKTVEVSYLKSGLPVTLDADSKLILGIPKSAFFENVPEAPAKDAAANVKADYRAKRHAARIALATYIVEVAQARLTKLSTVADPKAKKAAKLEKLRAQIAALESEEENEE